VPRPPPTSPPSPPLCASRLDTPSPPCCAPFPQPVPPLPPTRRESRDEAENASACLRAGAHRPGRKDAVCVKPSLEPALPTHPHSPPTPHACIQLVAANPPTPRAHTHTHIHTISATSPRAQATNIHPFALIPFQFILPTISYPHHPYETLTIHCPHAAVRCKLDQIHPHERESGARSPSAPPLAPPHTPHPPLASRPLAFRPTPARP
jgi:hypothetical protein